MYGHGRTTGQDGAYTLTTQWVILLQFNTHTHRVGLKAPHPPTLYPCEGRKCNVTPRSESRVLILHIAGGQSHKHTLTHLLDYSHRGHTHTMACTGRWGLTCLALAALGTQILHVLMAFVFLGGWCRLSPCLSLLSWAAPPSAAVTSLLTAPRRRNPKTCESLLGVLAFAISVHFIYSSAKVKNVT